MDYELENQLRDFVRKVNRPDFSFSEGATERLVKWVSCGQVEVTKRGPAQDTQKQLNKFVQDNQRAKDYKNNKKI